jgi:hypothetical protein
MRIHDDYVRISATITYDGIKGVLWFQSGHRHNFRLDSMPPRCFLPNMGTYVAENIYYGEVGAIVIDLLIDDASRPMLIAGAAFTLHGSPSEVTAHGIIREVHDRVDGVLPRSVYEQTSNPSIS